MFWKFLWALAVAILGNDEGIRSRSSSPGAATIEQTVTVTGSGYCICMAMNTGQGSGIHSRMARSYAGAIGSFTHAWSGKQI
jgi:hypothetical protein